MAPRAARASAKFCLPGFQMTIHYHNKGAGRHPFSRYVQPVNGMAGTNSYIRRCRPS